MTRKRNRKDETKFLNLGTKVWKSMYLNKCIDCPMYQKIPYLPPFQGSKGHGAASDGWKAEMSAFSISSILGGHYE
jgi:hypothetical protein